MIDDTLRINKVEDFNRWAGVDTKHPLVSAFTHPEDKLVQAYRHYHNVYEVVLMIDWAGDILYGNDKYNYTAGTLIFIAPGQFTDFRYMKREYVPRGRVLLWHPDLIAGTSLANKIKRFSYFSYNVNEALLLTEREQRIVRDLMDNIEELLDEPRSPNGDMLIVGNIELLLTYCQHFYERQFKTHICENNALLSKLEALVNGYLSSDRPLREGLLTVKFCAEQLNLSANYFSDLIRSFTGQSALKYLHGKLIEFAKYRLAGSDKTINEVAYSLGFEYPQHFTRLFRRYVGCSPAEYRKRNA